MTHLRALCRRQCRVLAVAGLLGWVLALFLAAVGEIAAGVEPGDALRPEAVAALAVSLLPEVLQVVVPFSVAHCLLQLEELGELQSLRAAGVAPGFLAVALLVPVAPVLAAMPELAHNARPAALAAAKRAALGPVQAMWRGLVGQGVGVVPDGGRLRALLPVGDAALAVAAAEVAERPGAMQLRGGELSWIAASGRVAAMKFESADLSIAPLRPGLADLTEKELSTRFLETSALRWWRSVVRGSRGLHAAVRREAARRGRVTPAVTAAVLLCLGLLVFRRRLTIGFVHGVATPAALAVSLFAPRITA